jgi:ribosomal protein S9
MGKMTMHNDIDKTAPESTLTIKMSTVLTIIVGLLSIAASVTNVWMYSISNKVEINGNRITALEQSQQSQDKMMEQYFLESRADRKDIKERLELYGERQIQFMTKLGIIPRDRSK